MIKIGLTGNIGSGKTAVCKIFEIAGVPVFYSDIEAKLLYKRDDVKKRLFERFNDSVFDSKNNVDFKKLAGKIFSNKQDLLFINGLIHPLVFEKYQKWLDENKDYPITIHESAILFENNLQNNFDKTIVVSCPQKVRLKRLKQRDKISESEILKRMKNQLSDEEKENLADYIIKNDEETLLIPQVLKLKSELLKLNQQSFNP